MTIRSSSGAEASVVSTAGRGPVPSEVTCSARNTSCPVCPVTNTTSPGSRRSDDHSRRLSPASCTIQVSPSAQTTVPRTVTPGVSGGSAFTSGIVSRAAVPSGSSISGSSGRSVSASTGAGNTVTLRRTASKRHTVRIFTQPTLFRHFSTIITFFATRGNLFVKKSAGTSETAPPCGRRLFQR